MTFSRPALALLAAGLAGVAWSLMPRAQARGAGTPSPYRPVRHAGPSELRLPYRHWSRTDEALDESFPASDPAARY